MLPTLDTVERAAAEGRLPALIAELDRTAETLEPGHPSREALTLLRRALRVDLALLHEHPDAAFSCLYYRCRWHGSPRARAFVETKLGDGVRLPPDSPSVLAELLEAWAHDRRRSGRPCLLSLRPSERGLESPLLEEYRGEVARGRLLVASAERIQLAFHEGAYRPGQPVEQRLKGWDRESGARLDETTTKAPWPESGIFVSAAGHFRIEGRDWGKGRLLDGTGQWLADLPIGEGRIWDARFIGEEQVVVVGDDDDDGGLMFFFDLRTRTVIERIAVPSTVYGVAATPDGGLIATRDGRGATVWERDTKKVRAQLAEGDIRELALSEDGKQLFTVHADAVRVSDLERIGHAPGLPGTREHWLTTAAFSPDGQRLVTGNWLCEAVGGAPLAHLDYTVGSYLEGGPAHDAFRMSDERIAYLGEGIAVWDRDGRWLSHRDAYDRRHVHWDLIAISADLRLFAVTRSARHHDRRGPQHVAIREIDSGAEVSRFVIPAASAMAFSPDGTRLAAGAPDGTVKIWTARNGAEAGGFAGHRGKVTGVAFLDDREVVSGAEDDAVRIWSAQTGQERWARPLDEGDHPYSRWSESEGGRSGRYWTATPEAVVEVERQAGRRRHEHPWVVRGDHGTLQVLHRETGQVAGWLPVYEPVVEHPRLPLWAGGPLHFALAHEHE